MVNRTIRHLILICLTTLALAGVELVKWHKQQLARYVHWDRIPLELGEWQGHYGEFDPVFGLDIADTTLLRVYQKDSEPPVIVYAGFHQDLPGSLDYHTPALCYPAQGWTILSQGKHLVGSFRGHTVRGSEIVVVKAGSFRLVLWWYHVGSEPFEKRLRQVYALVGKALVTGRTDGAIVRVETPFEEGGEHEARDRVLTFAKAMLPELEAALPR